MCDVEEWRDVVGYEGLYQVSSLGRLKSVERITIYRSGFKRTVPEKILSTNNKKRAYQRVSLRKDISVRKIEYVIHRLVAEAFIHNPEKYPYVHHIDSNKHNNRANNLSWVTQLMNAQAASRDGRYENSWNRKGIKPTHKVLYDNRISFPSLIFASKFLKISKYLIRRAIHHNKGIYKDLFTKY